jgi:hypothetical protein
VKGVKGRKVKDGIERQEQKHNWKGKCLPIFRSLRLIGLLGSAKSRHLDDLSTIVLEQYEEYKGFQGT